MKDRELRRALILAGYVEEDRDGDLSGKDHPRKEFKKLFPGAYNVYEAIDILHQRQQAIIDALGYEFIDEPEQPPRTVCKRKPANRRARK